MGTGGGLRDKVSGKGQIIIQRGKRTKRLLLQVGLWHLVDQDAAENNVRCKGPSRHGYADKARYTDAFDREVWRIISGFACGLRNEFIFARTGGEQITRTFCGHASLIQVRR